MTGTFPKLGSVFHIADTHFQASTTIELTHSHEGLTNHDLYLKWVTNGQMQALTILKAPHIVETTLVRHMNTNAPIYTNYKEVEVVTQAYPCAKSHFLS